MKNKLLTLGINIFLIFTIYFLAPEAANAAQCYSLNGNPPLPGEAFVCILGNIWTFAQWIFIVLAIVFTTMLIYKTITNRENSKVLETLPTQWMYLIIFFLLAFGAGGTILGFIFQLFGFGTLDTWITPISKIVEKWDAMVVL